jgi:4-hydroxybenzoyl-CoA reductase subunit gamma
LISVRQSAAPAAARAGSLILVMAACAETAPAGDLARSIRVPAARRRGAVMQEVAVRSTKRLLRLTLNGHQREDAVADNQLLVEYLRDVARLTGVKTGCDGGECGACTVLVDGEAVPSCITLVVRCEGRHVETIEDLVRNGRPSRLQRAFHEKLGAQCGFCTPGMIMAAEALLRRSPSPSEQEIRTALSGNLCRCTGYVKIVESVTAAAREQP